MGLGRERGDYAMTITVWSNDSVTCKCGVALGLYAKIAGFLQQASDPPHRCQCECGNVVEWRANPGGRGGAFYWLNRQERRRFRRAGLRGEVFRQT